MLVHDHGTGLQIQGFDADYTLFLIDGQPVIGRTAGTLDLDRIPVDIDTNREHPYFKRVMLYKGEYSPSDILTVEKPAGNWTGGDITVGYGVANWYRFQGDAALADEIQEKILETPYWNAWAWVVTDREASRRP